MAYSKTIKKLLLATFWILIIGISFFASWYVIHGDIQYTSDVARDFLLLEQIHQKGIVLIGPSSTTKLYHGILWMYLNYPAYVLGHGNPVVLGWFWIFLAGVSSFFDFFIAKKLFSLKTAYLFTLILTFFYAFHLHYFYNPDGAMLIMPAVYFFFLRFLQTKQLRFLLIHVLCLGAVIQFEMAIGIPLSILSFLWILVMSIQQKSYKSLLSFFILPCTLLNFIIFDLRHKFLITNLVFHFLTSAGRSHGNIFSMIWQRILFMTSSVEFFHLTLDPWHLNLFVAVIVGILLFLQLRKNRFVLEYTVFLYFYIGFFVISLANAGGLLYFYVYPLFPLVFLIFASFVESDYKMIFLALFLIIFLANIHEAFLESQQEVNAVGKSTDSWAFYQELAQKVFSGKENSFGYFTFDPDIVAYQAKYAMLYESKLSTKKAYYFQKKDITYVTVASNLYHEENWWITNLLHISRNPVQVVAFSDGYKIEKFHLEGNDLIQATEANIDPGLMFR